MPPPSLPMSLPSPSAFGLPDRFAEWRPEQERAILEAIDAQERFITFCLPTGSGKSLTPISIAQILGLRTCVLTSTKSLQDQYSDPQNGFPELVRDLRGRGNYSCLALMPGGEFHDGAASDGTSTSTSGLASFAASVGIKRGNQQFISAESGPCFSNVNCSLKSGGCTYFDAVRAARASQIVVTNYSKWLTADVDRDLGEFDLLVLDEAHAAADELSDALAVELEYWEVESLIGGKWPRFDGDRTMHEWMLWARVAGERVRGRIELLSAEMRNHDGRVQRARIDELKNLRSLENKLSTIAAAKGQWVADDLVRVSREGKRKVVGARFDPVWPSAYAEGKLFRGIEKVLLMSATIRPKSLELLGIDRRQSRFIEYPSSFPVARRPVTAVPTVRMSHRATEADIEKLIDRVDAIIDSRYDKRIIIHTVSYARASLIASLSRNKNVMIAHGPRDAKEAVRRFRETAPPVVLVSPSVSTGVDFPGDAAEVCIIVKVPFADMRTRVLKARVLSDKEYGNYLAAQELVQMTGRGMRSATDRFETIIIDSHVCWFVYSNKHLFPRWWLNAFRKSATLPKPLQKL